MGFFGSGSFNKSKTSAKSTATTTSTGTSRQRAYLDDAFKQPAIDLMGNVSNLAKTDPTTLVPKDNAFQTEAAGRVNSLTGNPEAFNQSNDWMKSVAGASAPQVNGESLLTGLSSYYNPFEKDVIDSSMADYDFSAGRDRAGDILGMAAGDAFRGSGGALTLAAGDDARRRGRFALGAGIRSAGFDRATALSASDADRRQQAAMANATFTGQQRDRTLEAARGLTANATAFDANQRANAGQTFDMGTQLRTQEQERATAPFDMQKYLTDLWGGLANPFFGSDEDVTENSTANTTSKGKSSGFGLTLGFGK